MKLVVKVGGAALDSRETVKKVASAVASLTEWGHRVAVVHGGGAALSRTMQRLGQQPCFIDGLRVTDAKTRDLALMVLAGQLNKQLVADIGAAGPPALGICGGDLGLLRAAKLRGKHDLGFVGQICSVEHQWLERLWEQGVVPVISSLALGAADHQYYNVNADAVASACAAACKVNALIFLTEVPGVKDTSGGVIRWLHVSEIEPMVRQSVVTGGMLPKLHACEEALRRGVNRVRIMPADRAELLPEFFACSLEHGTEVLAS